ncbi:putative DUF1275 domain protein [Diplocarpon rosae]|nr:putative DUF1275 domain protein [Diplocarpon rosae]
MTASSNGYGAVGNTVNGDRSGHGSDEEQPLLGRTSKSHWRQKMTVNVSRDWADTVLLLCYTITGLLDSASISTWGSFVSMQTGNTVYIGIGLSAPRESPRWIKSGVSLISFCIGSFCFSRFHRFLGVSRRWVLCTSFLLQSTLIVGAASILTWSSQSTTETDDISWHVLVPIALVAFQSCGQAVTSRALKFNALTSVVLTSIYCDLFSDAELFSLQNVERNRRVGAPVFLLFGALMGGWLVRSALGAAGVLWIAAGLKLIVVVAWSLWPAEKE